MLIMPTLFRFLVIYCNTHTHTHTHNLTNVSIHHRSLEDYLPISNPYNSSMYRMAASHKDTPRRLFLQKFVSNEIIPPYVIDVAEVNKELQTATK